ncbi:tetratricopeptide repeat protein, partial [Planktothrix tepida]
IKGEKAQNIEQAIAAYQSALEIRTREAFPEDWAMIQNNLANAYSNRIKGEKAQNIEQAIAAYQSALEIRT